MHADPIFFLHVCIIIVVVDSMEVVIILQIGGVAPGTGTSSKHNIIGIIVLVARFLASMIVAVGDGVFMIIPDVLEVRRLLLLFYLEKGHRRIKSFDCRLS